jgi:hypothetical protein
MSMRLTMLDMVGPTLLSCLAAGLEPMPASFLKQHLKR